MERPASSLIYLIVACALGQCASRPVNITGAWVLPQEGFPHFFRYFKRSATLEEAKASCDSFGAELVTLENADRKAAVEAFIKELDVQSGYIWMGLERPKANSPFMWTGGEMGSFVEDGDWEYSNPIEPEHLCVAISPLNDNRWATFDCQGAQINKYICQLPVPNWAYGENSCLQISLPSLTVTYLPEIDVIELVADCGLSGTKRIACKETEKENHEELKKRLSCDRDDGMRSSTQGWTDMAGHKYGTTTTAGWSGGSTARSWGTRHKRESKATSTSTDSSVVEENTTKSTDDDGNVSRFGTDKKPLIAVVIETEHVSPKVTEHAVVESSTAVSSESYAPKNVELDVKVAPGKTHDKGDAKLPKDDNLILYLTSFSGTTSSDYKELEMTGFLFPESEVAHSEETSTVLDITDSTDIVDIINVLEQINSSTSEAKTTVSPISRKDSPRQINPPMTLRSGNQPGKIDTVARRPELSGKELGIQTEASDKVAEAEALETVPPVIVLHAVTEKPAIEVPATDKSTVNPFQAMGHQTEFPKVIEEGSSTQRQGVTDENRKEPSDSNVMMIDSYHPTALVATVTEDKKLVQPDHTENKKTIEATMNFTTVEDEDVSDFYVLNVERLPALNPTLPEEKNPFDPSTQKTEVVTNHQTEIPAAVAKDLVDTQIATTEGHNQESKTIANVIPTVTGNTTEPSKLKESQLETHRVVEPLHGFRGHIPSKILDAVHQTNRPVYFEEEHVHILDDGNLLKVEGIREIPTDFYILAGVEDKHTTTVAPHERIVETTQKPVEMEKIPDFHTEDSVDENPKRSVRGRTYPHSSSLSFYPYFINRVLG